MIDLNTIVSESLKKMEEEHYVEKVVKQRLESTIKEIVDDIFREYSDFGKNLKKHIEDNLNVNLADLNIEGYNTLVLKAIEQQLNKIITVQGIEKIEETTKNMLSNVKEEYTLSELISKAKEEDYKDEWEHDCDDKIYLKITNDGSFTRIYIDTDEDTSNKYSADYQINLNEGKPYSIKLKNEEIDKNKILGGLYGLDKLLFKIYAHGSKIILDKGEDPEDYDIYFREDY